MTLRGRVVCLLAVLWAAGCAAPPPMPIEDYEEPAVAATEPVPMIEYPPIEPVEPAPVPVAVTPVSPVPAEIAPVPKAEAAPAPAPVGAAPAELSVEEQQMNGLLSDLQRYGGLPAEEARRELNAVTQALARQRTDVNRVRLAMLYTVTRTGPQDDLRSLQLLDNVAKSGPGLPPVKQLAVVLHVQISERVRAVRDEQQKADAAVQKLEALRAMERSLLRDRVRGGGGSGGGSGGGGGGGGGSGGGAGG